MKRLLLFGVVILVIATLLASTAAAQWTKQTSNTTQRIRCLRALNSQLVWACGNLGTVVRTLDGGTTWELKTAPLATMSFYSIDALDSLTAWVWGTDNAVTSTGDSRLYKTTDGGKTWVQKYQNTDSYADGLRFFDATTGLAYGDPTSTRKSKMLILKTTDAGETWSPIPDASIPAVDSVADEVGVGNGFHVLGNTFSIATYGNTTDMPIRVLQSTDRGATWTLSPFVQMANSYAIAMKDANTGIICNYNGEIGRTTDNWATSKVDSVLGAVYGLRGITYVPTTNSLVVVGGPTSTGFSATSLNGGNTWTQVAVPAGAARLYVVTFLTPTTGWAAGNSGTILKWSGPALTDVADQNTGIPSDFILHQNYPNPFNPSTTISFGVPKASVVDVGVYDILGKRVATIASGPHQAGTFSVSFDGAHLSSGIYYCVLRSEAAVLTKSLILLK